MSMSAVTMFMTRTRARSAASALSGGVNAAAAQVSASASCMGRIQLRLRPRRGQDQRSTHGAHSTLSAHGRASAPASVITVSDVLQQILGGVADEFKTDDPAPEQLPDGRIRLPGGVRLEEASDLLGADWEGTSATVAGFLMERIERLPRSGEEFVIDGVPVEVEAMEGRTVVSIVAQPVRRPEAAG